MKLFNFLKGGKRKEMPRFKTKISDTDDYEQVEEQEVKTKRPEIKSKDSDPKVIEREINLQLINDKLNYIIARLEEFE